MLETEHGGIQVYQTALECVLNEDLKGEWEKYLEQTQNHERIVLRVIEELGPDPEQKTPGRAVVHHIGESLVKAMQMAQTDGTPEGAQLVACECVMQAETKDHLNWELLQEVASKSMGEYSREPSTRSRTRRTSTGLAGCGATAPLHSLLFCVEDSSARAGAHHAQRQFSSENAHDKDTSRR
jgi:rubrerythrin